MQKGEPAKYQPTRSDMLVVGGFFAIAGTLWAVLMPRDYVVGPTNIPGWLVGLAVAIFGVYILLNKDNSSLRKRAGRLGDVGADFTKRDPGE